MQAAGGRSLVRKVSMEPRYKSKKKSRAAPKLGLQRYLSVRGTPNGVHEFMRSTRIRVPVNNSGIVVGATAGSGFGLVFNFSEAVLLTSAGGQVNAAIPNFAELAALFDQIKLDKVRVTFSSTNQSGDITAAPPAPPANTGQSILIQTCLDYNAVVAPGTESSIQEYGTYQQTYMDAGALHCRDLKPMYQVGIVDATGALSGAESKRGYCKNTSNITHSGVFGWAIGPTLSISMDIIIQYHFKCKNTK